MQPGIPHLFAIDEPAINTVTRLRHRAGLHPGCIRAMIRFGKPKSHPVRTRQHAADKFLLLFRCPEIAKHQDLWKIPDDGTFILQIIVKPQTLGRQVLTNNRHIQVAAVRPAKLLWQCIAQVPRRISAPTHLTQQLLPIFARKPLIVPVRPRMFTPMVEKANIVVLVLKRLDLFLDKRIKLTQIVT